MAGTERGAASALRPSCLLGVVQVDTEVASHAIHNRRKIGERNVVVGDCFGRSTLWHLVNCVVLGQVELLPETAEHFLFDVVGVASERESPPVSGNPAVGAVLLETV